MPKNRAEWWAAKLGRNKLRDRLVTRTLQRQGWRVARVWECDLARKTSESVRGHGWPRIARRVQQALAG